MKKILSRIENLLLIIPGILALGEAIFMGDSALDLHVHDTYLVIAHFNIWISFFVLNLIPFGCHLLLRMKNKTNTWICFIHVLITCILLVCYMVSSINKIGQPRRYYDLSSWGSLWRFPGYVNYLVIIFFIFLIIHLLFLIYTVFKLFSKKASPKI